MYEKLVEQLGSYSKKYRSGETLGRAIQYTEDLLDEASAAIETLETLFENYESVVNTKNRLAVKVHELQSELEQAKRERDEVISCLCLYAVADAPAFCEDCDESEENCNESCTWFDDPCGNCNQYEKDNWEWRGVRRTPMKLIDGDNLISRFEKASEILGSDLFPLPYIKQCVQEIPAIEPESLMGHGEWQWIQGVSEDEYICRCSVCKKSAISHIVDYEVNGEHETADCLRQCIDLIDGMPAADVAPTRAELCKAIDLLHKNYEKALNSPYVRDPIAWTLYHTWKEMNGGLTMAEYIEREDALKVLKIARGYCPFAYEEIKNIPAADVVEVVRCKDCKYSRPMDDIEKMEYYESVIICESFEMNDCATAVYPDDFCSYGEREDKHV